MVDWDNLLSYKTVKIISIRDSKFSNKLKEKI